MELRGFDSYKITLGDEMRGERASMGKSLEDAERDMRLKASIIQAIENSDLGAFPNPSVVAGYVRSYARYLGMDVDECYERFCRESGFQSPVAMLGSNDMSPGRRSQASAALNCGVGSEIARSRFAAPPSNGGQLARVSLSALGSSLALFALVGGLGYGGYALLKDIQRVGFAPLPSAPNVIADAPEIAPPETDVAEVVRPAAEDYSGGGILAVMAAPADLPPIAVPDRDGPISAIDPETAGVFAQDPKQTAAAMREIEPMHQHGPIIAPEQFAEVHGAPIAEPPKAITLHASEDAWIRVKEGPDTVLFEGILVAGQRFDLPDRVAEPVLKAGNAGGIYVILDGVAYGPVGARGQVARNVSLLADDVREQMPQAEASILQAEPPAETHQRAEAALASD